MRVSKYYSNLYQTAGQFNRPLLKHCFFLARELERLADGDEQAQQMLESISHELGIDEVKENKDDDEEAPVWQNLQLQI